MLQTWHDLLFAHWSIDPRIMRALVPPELPLHTFEGKCWLAVAPFRMSGIRAHGLPPFPGLSRFPELNVRTYVTLDGKPGVYFFSLDAASLTTVRGARRFYHLPYFHAEMSLTQDGEWIRYRSSRRRSLAEFRGRYRPIGPVQLREPGSLPHWLSERYCLYTVFEGKAFRAEIHHQQWPLQDAELETEINSMADAAGIPLPPEPPLLQFSRRLEVLIWPLRRIG
jgi:uncharacterized protein